MKAVKYVLMLPVIFMGILAIYFIFTVLNKAYWDAQVAHLCETEGGVTVYEAVDLNASEYTDIPKTLSGIPFMESDSTRSPEDPFYLTFLRTSEREIDGVSISKSIQSIVRTADSKILGVKISYGRSGGDFTTLGSPESSFSCDDIGEGPVVLSTQVFNLNGVK